MKFNPNKLLLLRILNFLSSFLAKDNTHYEYVYTEGFEK
jgi:hypothetical protein